MRFPNAYMQGLLGARNKLSKGTKIVARPAMPGEAVFNQRTGTRDAPQRWKTVHETSKKETADSRWFAEMKKRYGSNIKDWPTLDKLSDMFDKTVVFDIETRTQTTFLLPKKYNLKAR